MLHHAATTPQTAASQTLYDRTFVVIIVSQICFTLANALMAHYARWIEHLGGGVRDVGWIMGMGSIAGLFMRPWLGQWINRVGARVTWGLGYVIFAAGSLGNLFLDDLGSLVYVLRTLLVLGPAFVFASALTYVSQSAPRERQTEAIGVMGAGGFVGMLTGPYLGDLILGAGERGREQFVLLFVTATGALVLPALLLAIVRPAQRRSDGGRVRLLDLARETRAHWPGAILLVHGVFGVCMAVPFGFLAKFIDDAAIDIGGQSEVGLFFLGYAGWGLVLRLASRKIPDRFGRRRVLFAGLLMMTAGMFSFLLVTPSRALWLVVPGLLCGSGHSLMFHTMTSLALERFPLELRGTASALALMVVDIGMIAGAPVLGLIGDELGYGWLFGSIGAACVVAMVVYGASEWRGLRRSP